VANLRLSGADVGEVIAGIGLLDAYGLDRALSFPSGVSSVASRCSWAKREIEERVNHAKFRQHFAVHELEAWLLSDVRIFPREVSRRIAAKTASPESVNLDEPPARLLEKAYRDGLRCGYKKAVDGPDLFQFLDPNVAYEKCPALKSMLDDMLALARTAGL